MSVCETFIKRTTRSGYGYRRMKFNKTINCALMCLTERQKNVTRGVMMVHTDIGNIELKNFEKKIFKNYLGKIFRLMSINFFELK